MSTAFQSESLNRLDYLAEVLADEYIIIAVDFK